MDIKLTDISLFLSIFQFIYEFHYMKTLTPDDSSMMKLVSRIKEMYYLDGGHAGGNFNY
jgi:hypothetical protein